MKRPPPRTTLTDTLSPYTTRFRSQRAGRLGRGPGDLDADFLGRGSLLGLAQVGRARQQHEAAVGAEIEALEEDVAEGVVAGQVVHALLAEHQQAVEAGFCQQMAGAVPPAGKLGFSEVQRHGVSGLQIDGGEAAAVVRLLALAGAAVAEEALVLGAGVAGQRLEDRKSTRLNSSH